VIDVISLSRLVGTVTFQRGLEYARRGAVLEVKVTQEPLRLSGSVRGALPQPYRVSVSVTLQGSTILSVAGLCSCPVSLNCKHVVALVIAGLSARREEAASPVIATPSWERALAPLLTTTADAPRTETVRLGLQFELMAAQGDPAAGAGAVAVPSPGRLGIRPVQQGAGSRWVRTGITWSTLGYAGYGRHRCDPVHLEWLAEVCAVATGSSLHYYGSVPAWIYLDDVSGGAVWDLLGQAEEVGVALVGSDKAQLPVVIAADQLAIVLDVVRADTGIQLQAVVAARDGSSQQHEALLLGDPVRALASWPGASDGVPLRERQISLAQFVTPQTGEVLSLLRAGPQKIPTQDEPKFLGIYLPVLRRRVNVVSRDGSFEVPQAVPPQLRCVVEHLPGQRTGLAWWWVYAGADKPEPLWPRFSAAAFRDLAAERAILAQLPDSLLHVRYLLDQGRLRDQVVLGGMEMLEFLAAVVPELVANPLIEVEILGEMNYRIAETAAVIGISGESGQDRDWFDLHITVTVDDEDVALQDIFLALASGQEFMILPSGTYFSLDSQRFEQLRKLIEEARLLHDSSHSTIRVSRFQASLWDELQRLGIPDEQATNWHQSVSSLMRTTEIQTQPIPTGFTAQLRPYQQEGFDWLSFLFDAGLGGILADDMGLGKTIQALALICRAVAAPTGSDAFLVIAPTSVVGNWKAEAAKFAPHLKVVTINETTTRRGVSIADLLDDADVVVTSYALFRIEFAQYEQQSWAGLILDEAQFVKNHQSLGFNNVKKLSTPFKLAITGTPMENNLMELWSLFSLTAPGLFGSPAKFGEYYQKPIEKLGDSEKLAQLRRRIRPLMLRRNKDQVVKDLPPKQEQVIELELNAKHQKVYQMHLQRERQKVLGLIGDMDKNRFTIFRSLTLLRQLSLDPSLIDEKYASIPSTKLDALMEQLDDVVAEGHRVLVFSQFTSFLGKVRTRLDSAGIEYCYLDGATKRRPQVLERFSSGTAPVFLISLKAGGFGLNLTEADYCILLDPWWNPATEMQAIDRAHRIGQRKTVMVYRLVAKGTIEEKVMALKANKAKLFSSVMNDDAAGSTALTADDIRSLLS